MRARGRGRSTSIVSTTRPGRGESSTIRSASRTASSTSWVTSTTVRGSLSSASASQRCIWARVSASSAPNGSSRHSTGRPASSVRRNATRWRIPPESSAGRARSKPSSPNAAKCSCAAARAAFLEVPPARSASPALSSARSQGSSPSRCGISAAGGEVTLPASGSESPQISSSSVDLPHPLGPTTATVSFAAARRLTSSSATTSP